MVNLTGGYKITIIINYKLFKLWMKNEGIFMKLTEFGKTIRKARLDAETSLLEMASALDVTSSYLSGLETGRKNITNEWTLKIKNYFITKGIIIDNLEQIADVSNKTVSLEGLTPAHQMLMAGFARTTPDDATIDKLKALLEAANPTKG